MNSPRRLLRPSSFGWLAALVLLALATGLSAALLDAPTLRWLRRHPSEWYLNHWVNGFRQLGKAWLAIWLLLLWGWLANRPRTALQALCALLLMVPLALPLKPIVRRPRPDAALAEPATSRSQPPGTLAASTRAGSPDQPRPARAKRPGDKSSFPSGDTATVFAVAAGLAPLLPVGWRLGLFAAAAAVGLLRIVSLDHYPSDVCAGAAFGVLAGWLAVCIGRRWPQLYDRPARWRHWRVTAAAGVLALFVLTSLFERINPIWVFLQPYGIPLLMVCLLAWSWRRLRMRRTRA